MAYTLFKCRAVIAPAFVSRCVMARSRRTPEGGEVGGGAPPGQAPAPTWRIFLAGRARKVRVGATAACLSPVRPPTGPVAISSRCVASEGREGRHPSHDVRSGFRPRRVDSRHGMYPNGSSAPRIFRGLARGFVEKPPVEACCHFGVSTRHAWTSRAPLPRSSQA